MGLMMKLLVDICAKHLVVSERFASDPGRVQLLHSVSFFPIEDQRTEIQKPAAIVARLNTVAYATAHRALVISQALHRSLLPFAVSAAESSFATSATTARRIPAGSASRLAGCEHVRSAVAPASGRRGYDSRQSDTAAARAFVDGLTIGVDRFHQLFFWAQPEGIPEVDRVVAGVGVQVDTALEPDGVLAGS